MLINLPDGMTRIEFAKHLKKFYLKIFNVTQKES